MRKTFFFLVFASFMACNSDKEAKVKSMTAKDSAVVENIAYPPVDNSIKFEMGDVSVTANMLEVYKAWKENKFSTVKKYFADTVMVKDGYGSTTYGSRDTVLAQMQAYRNNYKSMEPRYHSFVSLKSTDRDDNWFLMWYEEYQTDLKGKTDSVELMENWKLNNDHKIVAIYQYLMHNPKPRKK